MKSQRKLAVGIDQLSADLYETPENMAQQKTMASPWVAQDAQEKYTAEPSKPKKGS